MYIFHNENDDIAWLPILGGDVGAASECGDTIVERVARDRF